MDDVNDLLKNVKPCFETSNSKVFINLHNAACEKAAKVLKLKYDPKSINTFMINTGLSKDGTHIENDLKKADTKAVGTFNFKQKKYEFGIVLQFTDFESPELQDTQSSTGEVEAFEKKNKNGLEKLRKRAYEAIKEYFKWFSGQDVNENDVVQFTPDYNGGEIVVKNFVIQEMDEEKKTEYFKNRTRNINDDNDHDGDEKILQNTAPRYGFKVGYVLVSEQVKSSEPSQDSNQ